MPLLRVEFELSGTPGLELFVVGLSEVGGDGDETSGEGGGVDGIIGDGGDDFGGEIEGGGAG